MSEQKPPSKKRWFIFAVIFMTIGVLLSVGFTAAVDYTNTTEFCVSCHSMKTNLVELEETAHWSSRSGVHAGCADCHVPKEFLPKMYAKIVAAKDVWHEIAGTINTTEKYEAHRWDMANRVWEKMRATDSRECRNCHSFVHMDLSEQERLARKKHEKATERKQTCIDCHKGLAHEEPEEPDDYEEDDDADPV